FRYETKYVVLNYLGMLPVRRSQTPAADQGSLHCRKRTIFVVTLCYKCRYKGADIRGFPLRPLDYQKFQSTAQDLAKHTQAGWSKVLVPLVLLQALQSEGRPLTTLLQLGLRCLEEDEAPFIIQQGGWVPIRADYFSATVLKSRCSGMNVPPMKAEHLVRNKASSALWQTQPGLGSGGPVV
ncbi:hypothetical protein XENOCAPTIV_023653, partial [Xenoophorus captivus]